MPSLRADRRSGGVVFKPLENVALAAALGEGARDLIATRARDNAPSRAGCRMAIEDACSCSAKLLAAAGSLESMLEDIPWHGGCRARTLRDREFPPISAWEQEQWQGIKNPRARPGELLHEATLALMQPY